MEQDLTIETRIEAKQRRQRVASWIQNSLRPVDRLMKYDDLFPSGDDETSAPRFEVREYQLDAWGALWDARQRGETHGLIHLATGLGKTSVAVFDVMKFREDFTAEHGRSPKIMFTVHQNDILEQAAQQFKTYIPDASIGFYSGRKKQKDNDITFATFQSLHANLHSFDSETFDYIIDDEVHHAKAHTYEKVVRHFKPQFRLGLTATPNRTDQKDIRDIYGDELYSKSLVEALAEGWLAEPDYHVVFDDAVKGAMQSGFEGNSLKALRGLFNVQPRNDTIAKNIMEEMQKLGLEFGSVKTIVFCQDIEHAEEMAELLAGKAYHSDANQNDRRQVFDEFKNGNLQLITTRDMFNEGVDIPDARLLVFLRSTSSRTIFEQQLGRGLRKTSGKERVSVLDFVANIERIAMIKELANQKNITERRKNNSQDRPNTEQDSEGGLIVRTNHGDFDFDKMAIDLLEKFNYIKSTTGYSDFVELSDDEIVELALSIKGDRPLNQSEIDKLSTQKLFLSSGAIYDRFGSMSAFQRACGFEVDVVLPKFQAKEMSDEELISLAKGLKPEGPLSKSEIDKLSKQRLFPSTVAIVRRFGNMTAFHQACGFEQRYTKMRSTTNEELIQAALEIKPDGPLSSSELNTLSRESRFMGPTSITRRFGSIEEFQKVCGFEVGIKRESDTLTPGRLTFNDLDNAEIVNLAQQLKPTGVLTKQEIKDLFRAGQFTSPSAILKRFGGMTEFAKTCGFDIASTSSYLQSLSNQELINLARELKPDGTLSQRDIRHLSSEGKFLNNYQVIEKFGSLIEFQRLTGGNIDKKTLTRRMSNDEIIELARLLSPNRALIAKDINKLSLSGDFVSLSLIGDRFGSLVTFQEACGFTPNSREAFKDKPNEDLISIAKSLKPEGVLTTAEMNTFSKEGKFVSSPTIARRFGSYQAFVDAYRKANG